MTDSANPTEAANRLSGQPRSTIPAGAIRRLLATLLDMALYCGLCGLLGLPVMQAIDWTALPVNIEEVTNTLADPSWVSHASGVLGMWIALWWCYFGVGWGLLGATPGKWAVGIRVADHKGRCPIGLTRGMMRLVAYGVSSITLGFGHLLLILRADGRALHDMLAGTRVVRRKKR